LKTKPLFSKICDIVNSPPQIQKSDEICGHFIFWVSWGDELVFSSFACFRGQNSQSFFFQPDTSNSFRKMEIVFFLYIKRSYLESRYIFRVKKLWK